MADAFDEIGAFHCSDYAEGPARGAHALVLDSGHFALRSPVDIYFNVAILINGWRGISHLSSQDSKVRLPELLESEVCEVVDRHLIGFVGLTVVLVYHLLVLEEDMPSEVGFLSLVLLAKADPKLLKTTVFHLLLPLVMKHGNAGESD